MQCKSEVDDYWSNNEASHKETEANSNVYGSFTFCKLVKILIKQQIHRGCQNNVQQQNVIDRLNNQIYF